VPLSETDTAHVPAMVFDGTCGTHACGITLVPDTAVLEVVGGLVQLRQMLLGSHFVDHCPEPAFGHMHPPFELSAFVIP
jgi:hypothetical protein